MHLPNTSLTALKSLGQHFLCDTRVLDKMLLYATNTDSMCVLEIGPGLGVLTKKLLEHGFDVYAIEKDTRFIEYLSTLNTSDTYKNKLIIENTDILKWRMNDNFKSHKYSIIANIPYNITSPILRRFLENEVHKPVYMLLMVQKEVAKKLTDSDEISVLRHSVDIYGRTEYCFTVSKNAFKPAPKVDSAVIKITLYDTPLVPHSDIKQVFSLINSGFQGRRKKLSNALKSHITDINILPDDVKTMLDKRAEELTIQNFMRINSAIKYKT